MLYIINHHVAEIREEKQHVVDFIVFFLFTPNVVSTIDNTTPALSILIVSLTLSHVEYKVLYILCTYSIRIILKKTKKKKLIRILKLDQGFFKGP